jgi:hypothetical protein
MCCDEGFGDSDWAQVLNGEYFFNGEKPKNNGGANPK